MFVLFLNHFGGGVITHRKIQRPRAPPAQPAAATHLLSVPVAPEPGWSPQRAALGVRGPCVPSAPLAC